ncbi:saccharopine dehydrogenase family protein [Nocardioides speluncae]|uniref:saccharopine dehydrogenase family protein n=1 Tax=Nocardioides speluncae TaxID=2670337 RepID=UPI000D685B2B|nr:saccharopine dehydrogenase NADP-binding domain-containing protein [Nocardioides speluncae]
MKSVVILSAGAVAADVAARVHDSPLATEITVADIDVDRARRVVRSLGLPEESARQVDAADPASVRAVVQGADLVFNGIGPYFRFGLIAVREAVAAGAHYVDICDEYDVAHALVTDADLDTEARSKGIVVLTGMGSSPGLSNLLARWAVDSLDEAESVEVVIGLPLFVDLGTTINAHMLHSLTGGVTQWLDGEYVEVPAWSDPQPFELLGRGGRHEFSYWGHPEAVTLPRYLKVNRATSRFSWFQQEGNELYRSFARWGLGEDQPLTDGGVPPRQFLAAHMSSDIARAGMSVDLSGEAMVSVWHVVATGTRNGVPTTVTIEGELDLLARREVSGPGLTGLPAAMGVLEVLRGAVTARGVVAPEACFDPEIFAVPAYAQMGVHLTRRVSTVERLV